MRRLSRRQLPIWATVLVLVLSYGLYYAQQQGWVNNAQASLHLQPGYYQVTRFVDGDTLEVNMNGTKQKIRLIGVDTPETHKPNTPVQCYGPAAANYLKTRIGSQGVRLESDSLSSNYDRYGRLLRYVYLSDGSNINRDIIYNGYGFYYPYFDFTKSDEFSSAQSSAQKANRGLWGNCTPTPTNGGGWVSNSSQ